MCVFQYKRTLFSESEYGEINFMLCFVRDIKNKSTSEY